MGAMLFICSFLSINLARYLMVQFIGSILNYYRHTNKITSNFKFVIWFSGFRGAMGKFKEMIFFYIKLSLCVGNSKFNKICTIREHHVNNYIDLYFNKRLFILNIKKIFSDIFLWRIFTTHSREARYSRKVKIIHE